MRAGIDAIAFDIDGTLYSNWSFYRRLGPFLIRHARFLAGFGKARDEVRAWQRANPGVPHADFLGWQANLVGERLGIPGDEARAMLDRLVYEGWKPLFARVKPYRHADECFRRCRESGLKIGILSDFLPSQKGDIWGLAAMADVVLGSEETGALKPSPVPFIALAAKLGVKPERILYVGNSVRSDVEGASACGMKTACIINPVARILGLTAPGADISFSSYRQLTRIVLE
jgi:putative hydrolase of the HAD superfamily